MIFDTHTHYDDAAFDSDREEVLNALPFSDIGHIVNIASDMTSSRSCLALAESYPFIHAAVGVHPDEVGEMKEGTLEELEALCKHPKCVAIGEIGLDYHGFDRYENKPSKELQQHWFKEQLKLAAHLQMPVVIHSRNAAEDTLEIMQWAKGTLGIKKAILHCFSYSKEIAHAYLDLGYILGFGGSLTYEGQKKITKALTETPLSSIVLETDCPYQTPLSKRGSRNDSRNLPEVIRKIAEIKGVHPDEVERITWRTATEFYKIS